MEIKSIKKRDRDLTKSLAIRLVVAIVFVAVVLEVKTGSKVSSFFLRESAGTQHSRSRREGPFGMPLKGAAYDIFQPLYDMSDDKKDTPIMAPLAQVIQTFEDRIKWVDTMVSKKALNDITQRDHAKLMYVETIKNFVSGVVYGKAELSTTPRLSGTLNAFALNNERRAGGKDWAYAGDTMTGLKRLDNVYELLKQVTNNGIKGDYIETGVWRGGSSVFAKAVISAMELDKDPDAPRRVSYVCDSFRGLPPGDRALDKDDVKKWANVPYLEIPAEIVANNFIKYGLLDSNVVFARGFFNETMPPLSKVIGPLSIMRLDVSAMLGV